MSSSLLHFHLPIPIQFLLSFLITIDQKQSSKISCDRLLEIPFWIVCCTHSLSFACSSCLNRMASIMMVEASIVCAANMDVTVLCRRLQTSIFTWFHCLHEVKSTIGRTCSRSSWFPSRISSVLASRCHREYCLSLTSFMVSLLGVTYYYHLNCHVRVRILICQFFFLRVLLFPCREN